MGQTKALPPDWCGRAAIQVRWHYPDLQSGKLPICFLARLTPGQPFIIHNVLVVSIEQTKSPAGSFDLAWQGFRV
jgi:hypothetical protein